MCRAGVALGMECDPTSHSLWLSPGPPLPSGCITPARNAVGSSALPKSNQLLIGKYLPLSQSPSLSLLHLSPDVMELPSLGWRGGNCLARTRRNGQERLWRVHPHVLSAGMEGTKSCRGGRNTFLKKFCNSNCTSHL